MPAEAQAALDTLVVGHWPGDSRPPALATAWRIETCLRGVLVGADREAGRSIGALAPPESYSGVAAYAFLLELACGLKSAVPGETNVFGQFKRAWEAHRSVAPAAAVAALAPVVAAAIRDTRAIRQAHLANIGGASYGGLVRRLIGAAPGDRVLFVGAGELARSMLPFFRACDIGIWNRHAPGAAFAAAGRLFDPEDGARAAQWAHHVIFTTPADPLNDARWRDWLATSLAQTVVHLGRRRDGGGWADHTVSYDLDDVFDLRRSQDNIRSLQIERARHACRDHARVLARATGTRQARQATG
jgi:hypothetical protein